MGYKPSVIRYLLLVIVAFIPALAFGDQDPNFSFDISGSDIIGDAPHTDYYSISASKPVLFLNLSLVTSHPFLGAPQVPSESMFLFDPNLVISTDLINNEDQLSVSVFFIPPSGFIGDLLVAKVKFAGGTHDTHAVSDGMFLDGSTFSTNTFVGIIPEPSTAALLICCIVPAVVRRRR